MTLGALIAAYQEDDEGGLRALLPLAGQTLVEYQARCAAAVEASPIVVLVERIPPQLHEALERLRGDGISVVTVGDAQEAASRFEPTGTILLLGDGVVPTPDLVAQITSAGEPLIATVPDDDVHDQFERIDAQSRWAGVAAIDGHLLSSTAAMLGDWDLQSTLLRRAVQDGVERVALDPSMGAPLLVDRAEQLGHFETALLSASRGSRRDFASRYLLPWIEDLATRELIAREVRPVWMIRAALALTLAASAGFFLGYPATSVVLLLLSAPLDLIAGRLAVLRLRPLPQTLFSRRMLWPAAGLALVALGWCSMKAGAGWGALASAAAAAAFAEAARRETPSLPLDGEVWLFSRRNAILLAVPFAALGGWAVLLAGLAIYAAGSFFLLQKVRHREFLH
ncbi:hypothetical protein G7077_13470 [Sphingomonas piscis]|uniref:Uncharacterized protein n=1 Tax=Sphingomonas piscis TaxID=2714943 RepID=A0A6G7YSP3_9SPHN|nr:hypothetical protein [Sphingomonas piscis]QIK79765.1 hypothetical protein G7077_13470 [Sphingomonas piscis]